MAPVPGKRNADTFDEMSQGESDDDEQEAVAKRQRVDQQNQQEWNSASTLDEKLGVLFKVGSDTNARVQASEVEVKKLKKQVKELQEEASNNKKTITELQEQVNFLLSGGQFSVIVHGVKEEEKEDTKKVADGVVQKSTGHKVDSRAAFRLGIKQDSKMRPIKIKLKTIDDKEKVLKEFIKVKEYNKANKTKYFFHADSTRSERLQRKETKNAYDQIKLVDPAATLKRGVIISKGERLTVDKEGRIEKKKAEPKS